MPWHDELIPIRWPSSLPADPDPKLLTRRRAAALCDHAVKGVRHESGVTLMLLRPRMDARIGCPVTVRRFLVTQTCMLAEVLFP